MNNLPIPNWKSLRDWRTARGLTVQALADRLGCSAVHVSRIERGFESLTASELAIMRSRLFSKEQP